MPKDLADKMRWAWLQGAQELAGTRIAVVTPFLPPRSIPENFYGVAKPAITIVLPPHRGRAPGMSDQGGMQTYQLPEGPPLTSAATWRTLFHVTLREVDACRHA